MNAHIAEQEACYQVYLLASADKAVFFQVERLRAGRMPWLLVLRTITKDAGTR